MHRGVCLPVLRSFELHTPPCSICTGSSPHRTHRNDAGSNSQRIAVKSDCGLRHGNQKSEQTGGSKI